MPNENTTRHATYPPSKLAYWEICPGWENEDFQSPAADEGTLLHHACETGNVEGLEEEQNQAVQMCRTYVGKLSRTVRGEEFRELRLNVAGLTWGTGDYILLKGGDSADIVDFKFGRNSVDDAEFNIQGWCYAIGLFTGRPEVKNITVHFLLPRRNEISTHLFTRDDHDRMLLRIKTIIERRKRYESTPDERDLKVDTKNCLYCGNKSACGPLSQIALRTAVAYDTTFRVPDQYHASLITDPNQMAIARGIADVLGRWSASVKEHATQMVLNGTEIPGWKLQSRQGNVSINDARAAFVAALEVAPEITLDEYVGVCSIGKTALVDLVKEKSPRGQKQRNAERLTAHLLGNGLAVRSEEVQFLVRDRD